MKRLFAVIGLIFLTVIPVLAQDAQALLFTRFERNPRTAAFAGAGTASVNGMSYSAFRQAAVLTQSGKTLDAGFNFQMLKPGEALDKTNSFNLGAAVNLGRFGFSLGGALQRGVTEDNFTPSQKLLALGLGFAIIPGKLSIGLNARLAKESIFKDPETGNELALNGFSADFSALYCINDAFSATLGVATLGNSVKGSEGTDPTPQPASAYLGGSWHPTFDQHSLELMLDGEVYFAGSATVALGAEYGFKNMLFARAGYRLAGRYGVPSHLALGLGFQFAGFRLDASYITLSQNKVLDNSFSVGLGYSF